MSELRNHKRVHTGEKPYESETCRRCFGTVSQLKTHQRIHTREKPHKCDECSMNFSLIGTLKTHKERVHGVKTRTHECVSCGARFVMKEDLAKHAKLHISEKPFKCPECGKSFANYGNLTIHR